MNGARRGHAEHTLAGLACVNGAHSYPQAVLAERLRQELRSLPDGKAAAQMVGFVYEHSAIDTRHLEIDVDAIASRADWYRMVNEATLTLARRGLDELTRRSGFSPAHCDALVCVSSTFAGFPALSRHLQESCAFPADALCFDLAGLGCAGPTHGLYVAHLLLQQGRCRRVCVVCADALGTHGQARRHETPPTMAQLVAHCLASDAAAAVVLESGGEAGLLRFGSAALYSGLWHGALDQNDFTACAQNRPFISVGKDIRTRLLPEVRAFLQRAGEREPIYFHPGGAALMRILAEAYPHLAASVDISSLIMQKNGNVGAASVLLVLEEALRRGAPVTPALRLFALGPGIVTTALTLGDVEVV